MEFNPLTIVGLIFIFVALIIIAKTAVVVPQQSAFVVERLGRFSGVLSAGFHFLIPFFDVIRYRHSLKEVAIDIPAQVCITRDNVQVGVDGILYIKVMNPERASYGIADYIFAIVQLAQTNLRSEIGKIDLDKTFEERIHINMQVVQELDKASEAWGVKVLRYEIKNITPPHDVLAAMEKQMRAKAPATPPSTPPRARSSRSSRPRKRGASSRSTKLRARRPRFWPSRPPPAKASARSPTPSGSRAAWRPHSCAWPRTTSSSSVSWPRRRTR
jgi:hypothetical protein